MNSKLIIGLILIGVVTLFSIQNSALVDIQILFWKIAIPRSLMIFLVLFIGICIGWFFRGHFIKKEKSKS